MKIHSLKIWMLLAVLIPSLAFMSCGDESETVPPIEMSDATQGVLTLGANELNSSFTFVAYADWKAWVIAAEKRKAESQADWISLNQYSGGAGEHTLHITLQPNTTEADRAAEIVVESGGTEIKISVIQKGKNEGGDVADADTCWTGYEELLIMDDGEDHSVGSGNYIFFKSPGFFKGGKGGEGQVMRLLDYGEIGWNAFSSMKFPEYSEDTWTRELVPCVKGHGYFSAECPSYWGDKITFTRFWVEDYIMEGDVIKGAKLRYHSYDLDGLEYADKNLYFTMSSAWGNFKHHIYFKVPNLMQVRGCALYICDGGKKAYGDDWEDNYPNPYAMSPQRVDIPLVRGHVYYTYDMVKKSYGTFYVCDYIMKDGNMVGVVLDIPRKTSRGYDWEDFSENENIPKEDDENEMAGEGGKISSIVYSLAGDYDESEKVTCEYLYYRDNPELVQHYRKKNKDFGTYVYEYKYTDKEITATSYEDGYPVYKMSLNEDGNIWEVNRHKGSDISSVASFQYYLSRMTYYGKSRVTYRSDDYHQVFSIGDKYFFYEKNREGNNNNLDLNAIFMFGDLSGKGYYDLFSPWRKLGPHSSYLLKEVRTQNGISYFYRYKFENGRLRRIYELMHNDELLSTYDITYTDDPKK